MTGIQIICVLACLICAALSMLGAHKVVKAFSSFFKAQDSLEGLFSSFSSGTISADSPLNTDRK